MASIVVAGDTSGTITLSAPAVAGTTTLTLPTTSGTVALTSQITTPLIKKISTYEYATRTNPPSSGVSFTWTSSFTMVDRVNNSLLVMGWIPADDPDNSNDYSGFGLRFTNGVNLYDTQGKGSNYVGFPAGSVAMTMQQYGFWVSPNLLPTGTLTLQHYLYTAGSNVLVCPNSTDDSRLNQTSAQLIIIEYGS